MIRSYLKIAWRNITRHRAHTAINVIGLALGMSCCLFIFLWVSDERNTDNFHARGADLYTAYTTTIADGKVVGSYNTPNRYTDSQNNILLEDVAAAVQGIQQTVLYEKGYELPWGHPESFQVGEKIARMKGSRATGNFFSLFSFPLIEGEPGSALKDLESIAISRKMAGIFFGTPAKAIGKTIRYENRLDFVVSSVFENLPPQSSLQFDFLLNWQTQKKHLLEYSSNDFATYLLLSPGADPRQIEPKINQFLQPRLDKQTGLQVRIGLQRFGDQYLHDAFVNGKPLDGRIGYVRLFSGVAIFILIIACINFMNLSTARSVKRAKEVGLRKVIGSTRGHLVGQFLGEALLFALLAMSVSILLLYILLPAFNLFTGKQIPTPLTHASFWASMIALSVVTGLIAGSYPALYLSSLKPVRILKGVLQFTAGAVFLRKGLTVFQFVLSIVLIVATLVITRQTQYVQNARLGYDKENLIYIRIDGDLVKEKNYLYFKQRAAAMPGIAMIDRCSEAVQEMNFVVSYPINWEGKDKNTLVGMKPASVGFDFIRLMGMTMASGRDFSRGIATDSSDAFIVNEEAAKRMGLKDPIGKWVSAWNKKGHIIGVVKDYHTQSLREAISPVLLDVKEGLDFGLIVARTRPGETKQALASLEKVYREANPGYAFTYQFVDEEYKKMYGSEQIISKISVLFSTLAILISCLGLLGLVMFAAEQRIREIGIRKVLGASLGEIIVLFSRDFLNLVFIAFAIAAPLGWYFMNQWLRDFAYRIDLSWWIFALAGGVAVLIALLTMSYQAVRSALANPVKSLRAE